MSVEIDRYYEVFGLKSGASLEEVKHVYHELVRVWHPDMFPDDPGMQAMAAERLKIINEAYAKLQACLTHRQACVPRYGQILAKITSAVAPRSRDSTQRKLRRHLILWLAGAGVLVLLGLFFFLYARPGKEPLPPKAQLPAPPTRPPAAGITLGSTKEEVWAIQGRPTSIHGNTWMYDLSAITFTDGRVSGYDNSGGNLLLKPIPTANSESGFFTLGSTPEEVLAVQGLPTAIEGDTWRYGLSTIIFDHQRRVIRYSNLSRNLRVRLLPPPALASSPPPFFDIGSTQEEVLAVQGTPTSILPHAWAYGDSRVNFYRGRVISIQNTGKNLRIKTP